MNNRTHWQYCAILDAGTLTVEEVGAFIGAELGPQPKGRRYEGKILMLIAQINTGSIEESRVGIRRIIEVRHPWVFERFPEARLEIMSEPERIAWMLEQERA